MEVFQDVQATALAVYLRKSIWAYPLVNTLHLLGIALLIGSVAVLDCRLIGLWRRVPARSLARVLMPVAAAGFVLAAAAGVLLFSVRAVDYAGLWLFQVKMVLLVLALANAVLFVRLPAWRRFAGAGDAAPDGAAAPPVLRLLALVSLLLWLAVLTFGRLVGYA